MGICPRLDCEELFHFEKILCAQLRLSGSHANVLSGALGSFGMISRTVNICFVEPFVLHGLVPLSSHLSLSAGGFSIPVSNHRPDGSRRPIGCSKCGRVAFAGKSLMTGCSGSCRSGTVLLNSVLRDVPAPLRRPHQDSLARVLFPHVRDLPPDVLAVGSSRTEGQPLLVHSQVVLILLSRLGRTVVIPVRRNYLNFHVRSIVNLNLFKSFLVEI